MRSSSSAVDEAGAAEQEPRAVEFAAPSGAPGRARRLPSRLTGALHPAHLGLLPGAMVIGLVVLWSAKDGGYDAQTWYWGALLILSALAWSLSLGRVVARPLSRELRLALGAFALYVGWSYLSILWAESPGDALDGSNRALMYLLLFATMVRLRWSPRSSLLALMALTLSIGGLALSLLVQLVSLGAGQSVLLNGRLQAPTGYFNGTVALFTMGALLSVAIAAQRTLPAVLRGLLLGLATACLELAVLGQSRGWLFTLPLILLAAVALISQRIRGTVLAGLPAAGTAGAGTALLRVFSTRQSTPALLQATHHAGKVGLLVACAVGVVGALLCLAEARLVPEHLPARAARRVGSALAAAAVLAAVAGGLAFTHGHPVRFVERQWNGFSAPAPAGAAQSYFEVVGSGRYDFWRVALHAFTAHPLTGLGQDNFADYYVSRRRTYEEPAWVHSFELRLLTHTGLVGAALFLSFLAAALAGALRARRTSDHATRWIAGAALLPLSVWLIHGSIDWFWEVPALTGMAFGLLAVAASLGGSAPGAQARAVPRPARGVAAARFLRGAAAVPGLRLAAGLLALCAAAAALAFPFLARTEMSSAARIAAADPAGAVARLRTAAQLDPLAALPDRQAGTILLQTGGYAQAESFFARAISREPDGWFSWLGAGVAAGALGQRAAAHRDLVRAASLNSRQPGVLDALRRLDAGHPLSPRQVLDELILIQ